MTFCGFVIELSIMHAKQEHWNYGRDESVWVGRYKNSHNILHWHYACELLELESGELDVFIDSERYTLRPGDAIFIGSEKVHYMHAATPETVARLFVFGRDAVDGFAKDVELESPLITHDYRLPELYGTLREVLTSRTKFCGAQAKCLLTMKLIEIFGGERTVARSEKEPRTQFKLLLADIDKNYEFYDLNRAAEFMAMNPAYLSRLFHKLVGLTFSQYLNIVRCENAVAMLQSGEDVSITQIAAECGFSTIRNFNRIFKQLTGYTPRTLPHNYKMKEYYSDRAAAVADPTLDESILLESSS